jgi:transposase-like protein
MSVHYTAEFRASAVALVLEQKYKVREAAANLGVNGQTLRYWIKLHRNAVRSTASPEDLALMDRVKELEKQLARVTMERDILKKATAFFAKDQL